MSGVEARLNQPVVPDVLRQYQDFKGRQLVVAANDNWPYFVIKTLQDGQRVAVSGIDVEILNTLADRLNFTQVHCDLMFPHTVYLYHISHAIPSCSNFKAHPPADIAWCRLQTGSGVVCNPTARWRVLSVWWCAEKLISPYVKSPSQVKLVDYRHELLRHIRHWGTEACQKEQCLQ